MYSKKYYLTIYKVAYFVEFRVKYYSLLNFYAYYGILIYTRNTLTNSSYQNRIITKRAIFVLLVYERSTQLLVIAL